ncbi:hypothetical protein CEXT_579501 [Caerostris extrusa]|uniref:Uncharacterized protein n=1 Tax=Caerostris extrusa TaxID=172846 RepID=A0AAV4V1C0_CAEEX|nr:hypothetical protein CEXT_579501 [Caerostris extrusa]
MKRDVLGHSAPKYTDLYELSQQVPVSCGNHLNGDDSSCSKRISFTFAKYLESVEENQWQTEDDKKEEEEEEEEKVVIDCRIVFWTRFVFQITMSNTQSF